MSTPYYTASGTPGTRASLSSAAVRAEFAIIAAGFALLPLLDISSALKPVRFNSAGSALEADPNNYLPLAGGTVTGNIVGTNFITASDLVAGSGRTGFSVTGNGPAVAYYGNSHANAGRLDVITSGSATEIQLSVNRVAGATRYITVAGSVAGNPTLGTSAGQLAVAAPLRETASGNTANDVASTYQLLSNVGQMFVDSTRTTDNHEAEWFWSSGALTGRFVNDAYSVAANFMGVTGGQAAGVTNIRFMTGGSSAEALRIDSSGRINVSASGANATYQLQVTGAGQQVSALTDAGVKGGALYLLDTASAGAGQGGALLFGGFNSATPFAAIKGFLTNAASQTAGDIRFSTRAAATDVALTERLVLDGPTGNLYATANTQTLGVTGSRWGNVFSVLGNFSGALTASSTLGVTGLITASAGIATGTNDNTGRGMPISRSKPATTSRVSTTAFTDDPDLVIPLGVGTYAIDCFMSIWGTASGAGGFKMSPVFTGTPTSSSFSASGFILGAAIANTTTTQGSGGGPYSGNTTTVSAGVSPSDWIRFHGTITVSVAGNFKIQWGQVASNANATNVGQGSWLIATPA